MQDRLERQEQAEQEKQELAQFNQQIDTFLGSNEKYKVVPKDLLIAYMSQGATPEQAAETIMDLVKTQITPAQQTTDTPAPTLMGGDGTVGSGLPDEALNVGKMGKGDTTDLVIKMLEAAAAENTQG